MESVFASYIEDQDDEEDEELPEQHRQRVPRKPDDDRVDEYALSLVVDESLSTSTRAQKRIKLASELERYYDAGLELQKIVNEDGNEELVTLCSPLTWWRNSGRILYPMLATEVALLLRCRTPNDYGHRRSN